MALNSVIGMCIACYTDRNAGLIAVLHPSSLECQCTSPNPPKPRMWPFPDRFKTWSLRPRALIWYRGPIHGIILRGRQSVDTSSVESCCRYPHLRYRLKSMSNICGTLFKACSRVELVKAYHWPEIWGHLTKKKRNEVDMAIPVKSRFLQMRARCEIITPNWIHP